MRTNLDFLGNHRINHRMPWVGRAFEDHLVLPSCHGRWQEKGWFVFLSPGSQYCFYLPDVNNNGYDVGIDNTGYLSLPYPWHCLTTSNCKLLRVRDGFLLWVCSTGPESLRDRKKAEICHTPLEQCWLWPKALQRKTGHHPGSSPEKLHDSSPNGKEAKVFKVV